jgi:malate dehydrogenase (oxaloacetate-decarboxylating)(NADP+)
MLEPTFGGINLEDIKAPECFYIEEELRKTMKIPVFHDDQHGTAIISGAGLLNALELTGKKIAEIKIVFNGAGAAAISCAAHYINLGVRRENIVMCDTKGVIFEGRTEHMNAYMARYASPTEARTLAEALVGADVFFGLSSRRRRHRRDGEADGPQPHHLRAGQPRPRNRLLYRRSRRAPTPSWPPAAPTSPTR